jgi:hypothetical protein
MCIYERMCHRPVMKSLGVSRETVAAEMSPEQVFLTFHTFSTPIHCFVFPMPPHVPYGLRGPPSWLYPKGNRLLSLGRP